MKGFTFLEVLFAIFIISLTIGGAFVLLQRNIATVSFLEHQTIALSLAQEGVETVHAIRNSNFVDTFEGGSSVFTSNGLNEATCGVAVGGCEIGCVGAGDTFPDCTPLASGLVEVALVPSQSFPLNFDESTAVYSQQGSGDPSLFTRKIFITEVGAVDTDYLLLLVEMSWNERGNIQKVELETRVYDWLPL